MHRYESCTEQLIRKALAPILREQGTVIARILADLEKLERRVEYLDKITPRFFSEPLVLHATGDDLDSVGVVVGIPPRDKGESDDTYRKKIIEKAYKASP